MAFVVDGADWNFDGWTSAQIQDVIESFLERLDGAVERSEKVWIGDDLQTRSVFGMRDLWSLRDVASGIQLDEGVWQELAAHLGRSPRYLDEPNWPPGLDDICLTIGDDPPADNVDVAWVHHSVRSGSAVACIGLARRGRILTASSQGQTDLHWIFDSASKAEFWRAAIVIEGNSQTDFKRLAHRAYPDLHFYADVLEDAKDFMGGYYANVEEMKRYLAVLNDHGHWVFATPPPAENRSDAISESKDAPPSQLVQRRFELLGLVVAPENPDVYRDNHCRTARQVELNGKTLYCEWHCKLQAHQNRIHFHAPVPESNNKVVVAIFAQHLPLP